ncbi:MAG: penicillin-binding transpeptidase domain-containing protein [Bacillota bacterium]
MLVKAFGAVTLFLAGVLARYQVLGSLGRPELRIPAFQQRYKGVPVTLPRGYILDRYGVPLHYPVWDVSLAVFPWEISQPDKVMGFCEDLLGISVDSLLEASSASIIKKHLRPDEIALVRSLALSGLEIVPNQIRYGPQSLATHVVGHVNPNDNQGTSGLEYRFQQQLAGGKPSWVGYVTTGEGVTLPQSGLRIAPNHGMPQDLVTTIDANVQKTVEDTLDSRGVITGAVVVLDASTGEVLAMASRPNMDQNDTSPKKGQPDDPLVNRAISAFPLGPLLEPLALSFALDNRAEGEMTPLELGRYARACGFLRLTGIPLPGESPGSFDKDLTATPLQIAAFYRAIAWDGVWRQPSLILGQEVRETRIMSSETADTLANKLLKQVRQGTGSEAWVPWWGSAGWAGAGWFSGWTPVILPRYAITVFVQQDREEPNEAALIFREIAFSLLSPVNGTGTRTLNAPHE